MSYFLRKDKKSKGIYLQMYERYWDKEFRDSRTKCVESFGYVSDLISDDVPDPVEYYTNLVAQREKERKAALLDETRPRISGECLELNVGHFLIKALIDELEVKEVVDILSRVHQYQFSIYDMITQLVCARIIDPRSKSKTVADVFPTMYGSVAISEDQVYDGLFFIGETYEKYIELFNHQYETFYKRDFSRVFFDCTNFYFEIDQPYDDKQKGPSKENRKDPIISQALLLDSELVPVGMKMFPGNESEKPQLRRNIEDMKRRYKVEGRTIQVADKGLNCARNIYAAVKESNDGYIFSKSVHGSNLSSTEKEWITLENGNNKFKEFRDLNGNLLYKLKSCEDEFEYSFEEINPETGAKEKTSFKVKEKRIVSYNPALAKKQQAEIQKMVDKACGYVSYKNIAKEDLGDSSKYVKAVKSDNSKIKLMINQDKINEDMKFAGYNLLVTSERSMSSEDVYKTYHELWKIEESFRITKSYLDARPVYVQKEETIYGHFLICYLALFLLRVLEIKCFKNAVNAYDIINFVRDFRVFKNDNDNYVNLTHNRKTNGLIKAATGLNVLDALYLKKDEIDKLFNSSILLG